MATVVTYGTATLGNVHTKEWNEEVMYDESGTDPIGVKYRLTFDAIVHVEVAPVTGATVYAAVGGGADNPVATLQQLKRQLERPRQTLTVTIGGRTVLSAIPFNLQAAGEWIEIDNGPKPRSFQVYHIASDRAFRIRWSVEATVLGCFESGSAAGYQRLINNRWTTRESMDETHRITRVVTGTLRVGAASKIDNTLLIHAERYLCYPPLEDGFARRAVTFTEEKSGLALQYQITDQQVHYAPPYPATMMRCRHTTRTADGYRFTQSCSVRLEGAPNCDVRDLLQRAVQIVQYRCNAEDVTGENTLNSNQRIVEASITEDVGEVPSIEMNLTLEEIGAIDRMALTRLRNRRFGTLELPPLAELNTENNQSEDIAGTEYQVNKFPVPPAWGYDSWKGARSPLALSFLRCVLQTQCGGAASLGQFAGTSDEKETPDYGRENEVEVYQSDSVESLNDPDIASTWGEEHLNAMYIRIAQDSRLQLQRPLARLPLAGASASGATTHLVKLSSGVFMRTVSIDFERLGRPPKIPPFLPHQIGNVNMTPTALELTTLPPRHSEDATVPIYRVTAVLTYYGDRELDLSSTIPLGRLPTVNSEFAPNTVALNDVFDASGDP